MALENTSAERILELVQKQRAFYATGTTRDIKWRIKQLNAFNAGLKKWEKPICDALWQDLHKSYEEAFITELGLVYGEIGEAIRILRLFKIYFIKVDGMFSLRLNGVVRGYILRS